MTHRIICAWCKRVINEGSEPPSHGICDECAAPQMSTQPSHEEIQMPDTHRYNMDDFTFSHLTTWCENSGPWSSDDATKNRNAIVEYLQSLPIEDAEYSISHGWMHVADLLRSRQERN